MQRNRLGRMATCVAAACLMFVTGARAGTLAAAVSDAVEQGALAGPAAQLEVEGKGTITAVAGTCPGARVLTILGIPVTVTASTILPSGQTCASLVVGQTVEVRGILSATGGTLSVVATSIEIEDPNGEVEGEGRITALTGTCPDLTLTVDGITVKTDALTKYVPSGLGASCAALQIGTKVKVKAVPAEGGGYRARLVEIRGHRNFMEGESRITAVQGSCPDLTVFFGNIEVKVNAGTQYRGGSCADLTVGARAFVKAFQDDGIGPITATVMYIKAHHVEGRSVVTSVTGTCPTLTLVVGGHKVVTNAQTEYENGTCASIIVGASIHVKGDMLTDDGSVIAEEIEIEGGGGGGGGGRHIERGEGIAMGVTGTCPAKSFTVGGYPVQTDASTTYEHGTCADLITGRRVEVEAWVDATHIVAARIELK